MIKRSITYRFISLTLALLMFMTSAAFSIDMHFCQDQLKSVSFFGKAKTCHDLMAVTLMKNCPHHQKMMTQQEGCSIDKKDCCENKTLHVQSDLDQQIQTADFVINPVLQQFVIAYVTVFFSTDLTFDIETVTSGHYKSPLLARDIPVLFASFLL